MLTPTLAEQQLLEDALDRDERAMSRRERRVELAVAAVFAAAVAGLWLWRPATASFEPLAAAVCVLGMAAAMHVRFDFASGFTAPTQLALVPLLFAVPAHAVPVAAALALVLARVPEVLAGHAAPSRLLTTPGNALNTLGPALVLGAVGGPPEAWTVALAVLAQLAVDFAGSVAREHLIRGARLREELRFALPVYAVDVALTPPALLAGLQLAERPAAALAVMPLLGIFAVFGMERRARVRSLIELNQAYRGTALVLGDVVEADDGYTGEHCRGVVATAMDVATELGLSADQRRNLEFGALLHDIGKIAIPKSIINKPGPLDPEEWTLVQTHTVEGQRMLDRVGGFMRDVGRIVRSHHERWDGTGYPDGLAGEAIPLEGRIIACCDAWNAMRTDRPYRKAMPYAAAVAELEAHRGRQFDPRVVDAVLVVTAREAPDAATLAA